MLVNTQALQHKYINIHIPTLDMWFNFIYFVHFGMRLMRLNLMLVSNRKINLTLPYGNGAFMIGII